MPFFCIHCKSEIDPKFRACPFCGDPITDFLRRYLETPLDGKYQILARLGVGGMGEVYKVLHIHLNSIRVIKLMRSNIATDPGAHDRFLREARLATKIHHSNVATLFDFSTLDDGSHYMVWEYIEGTNLHELVDQRGPLSPRYAARLAAQALMGLDAIHRAGIVHRDVSPENLMITHDDEGERVKIIDLGIAKSSGAEDNNTKTGMFVGKWKYCSPEHLGMLSGTERIDGRADIYSFGIVLYEMLTGVPPFHADTPHGYLMAHSQSQPKSLRDSNPGVMATPELEALIFRALEKDRTMRFATAREFAQALEALAPTLSDAAGAPPPLPTTAEITNPQTQPAERFETDAATVMSTEQDAPTVITKNTPPPGRVFFERVTSDVSPLPVAIRPDPPAEAKRRPATAAIAAVVAIAIALGGWMMFRERPATADAAPAPMQAATLPPQMPAATQGLLAVNAFPWGTVTSIRNTDNGEDVEIAENSTTPVSFDLPPGNYEVTLSQPRSSKTISRKVTIAAGAEEILNVPFGKPESAPLPDFGGGR
ncbi:MAG TPA: protein kinase [Thermoanaerobaculia bacterium]|nr:protein kinase [Thermoanaerobaculia bacterium]